VTQRRAAEREPLLTARFVVVVTSGIFYFMALGALLPVVPRYVDKQLNWLALLAPEIASRLGKAGVVPTGDLELSARAIVSTALICLSLASEAWATQDGAVDIGVLYDAAIGAVRA